MRISGSLLIAWIGALMASSCSKEVTEAFPIALRPTTTVPSEWSVAVGTEGANRVAFGRIGVWLVNEEGTKVGERGEARFFAAEMTAALERALLLRGSSPVSLEALDGLQGDFLSADFCFGEDGLDPGPKLAEVVEEGRFVSIRIIGDGDVEVESSPVIGEQVDPARDEPNVVKTVNCALRGGFPMRPLPPAFSQLELSEDRWGSVHQLLQWGVSHPAFMSWLGDTARLETLLWVDGLQQSCEQFDTWGFPLSQGRPSAERISKLKADILEWVHHKDSAGRISPGEALRVTEAVIDALIQLVSGPEIFGSSEFSRAIRAILEDGANKNFFKQISKDKKGFLIMVKDRFGQIMANDLWVCTATGRIRLLDVRSAVVVAGAVFSDRYVVDKKAGSPGIVEALHGERVAQRAICLFAEIPEETCIGVEGYKLFLDFDVLVRTTTTTKE